MIAFCLVDERNLDDLMRMTAKAFGYGKVHRSVGFSCMSAIGVSDGRRRETRVDGCFSQGIGCEQFGGLEGLRVYIEARHRGHGCARLAQK